MPEWAQTVQRSGVIQGFPPAEPLQVDLGQLFQPIPMGLISAHPRLGRLLLHGVLSKDFRMGPGPRLAMR